MPETPSSQANSLIARLKYLFATEVAGIPPKKVRTLLQQQGWQFEPVTPDPLLIASASAFGGHYGVQHLPCVNVKSPAGHDVYAEGNDALYRIYRKDLRQAARSVYLVAPD